MDARPWTPPAGKKSEVSIDYSQILPERFDISIDERYALDKTAVGEGGFGKVFVATDRELDRLVAVKRCPIMCGDSLSDDHSKDIQAEIRIMTELDHPSICKLFETWEEGIHKYFIMEYCEGGELLEKINDLGHISEEMSVDIISQITGALHYAHHKCIAHRDIKPDNIVMCSKDPADTRIKVIDWGLACHFSGRSMMRPVGACLFAAPEVLNPGKSYDCSCDMWSLGIVTYLMLCGQLPITGSYERVLFLAKAEKYLREGPLWEQVSTDARDFIRNLLKAEPSRRLTSLEAMRHDWLMNHKRRLSRKTRAEGTTNLEAVFKNLQKFKEEDFFRQLCTVAVARQLDFKKLGDIHRIFRQLDTNNDGTLSYREISCGWERINGKQTFSNQELESLFSYLDLNGSGEVDYTEFCAAGLGESVISKNEMAGTAFRALDVDSSGKLSAQKLQLVLKSKDLEAALSIEVCEVAAQELLERFDTDMNGEVELVEWLGVVRRAWTNRQLTVSLELGDNFRREGSGDGEAQASFATDGTDLTSTYMTLMQVNQLEGIAEEPSVAEIPAE